MIGISVSAIYWGSSEYVSKNVNRSIEYGGGVESLIQVQTPEGNKADEKLVEDVQKSIFDRLSQGTGLNGVDASIEGDGKISISKSGISTDEEKRNFEKEIISKPSLSITDVFGKPLFYDGIFEENGSLTRTDVSWSPPLKPGGASALPAPDGSGNQVLVNLKDNEAQIQWSKATEYISKNPYIKTIIIWLNLKDLIKLAETKFPEQWEKANKNPYFFVHVNESPFGSTETINGEQKQIPALLKTADFNAADYMISAASVNQALNGSNFVIQGNFTSNEAAKLASNINYGSALYELKLLSSNFVPASIGEIAFTAAIWAGIVAFSLIAIFLLVNYGLLGALSTISLSLYIFLTLLMFTLLRGEYSPAKIAALVVGIGMSVDSNVLMFERFKREVYSGNNVIKSYNKSAKLSLSSILNSNITTLIVGVILFYFGTKSIKGFSITLILSVIFILVVSLLFTRYSAQILIKTGFFNDHKRLHWLGIVRKYKTKIDKEGYIPVLERPNYIKYNKIYNAIPFAIILLAIIMFTIFAIIGGNFSDGFNKSIEFSGGTSLTITGSDSNNYISLEKAKSIVDTLVENGVLNDKNQIQTLALDESNSNFSVRVLTNQDLTDNLTKIENALANKFGRTLTSNTFAVSSQEAENLVKNAFLAISISLLAVGLYTLIVMKWTFAIAAIVALIQDVLITTALFVIFRLQFSPIFIAAALSIIGYSINNTIVMFDRIKEVIIKSNHDPDAFLSKDKIKTIANFAIKDIIKRSLLTTFTTIITVLVLIGFKDSTDILFNLALLFGLIFGTFSSLFLSTQIWVLLETYRNKQKQKRIESNYWNKQKIREQNFNGINDYSV